MEHSDGGASQLCDLGLRLCDLRLQLRSLGGGGIYGSHVAGGGGLERSVLLSLGLGGGGDHLL